MQSRVQEGERRLTALFGAVVTKARVFQGGGNELTTASLRDGVETAGRHALSRQFPKFGTGDHKDWSKVITKARDGAPDALSAIGWPGETPANPVCKEVLARTSAAGTKGSELQKDLGDAPYGWPKDAIDGALLALLANGNILAKREGLPVSNAKELPATLIGKATFFKDDDPPTTTERLAVKGVLTEAKIQYTPGLEGAAISGLVQHFSDLAARAGGAAPLPECPDIKLVQGFAALAGNQQFREVARVAEQLRQDNSGWSALSSIRPAREAAWAKLHRLLDHAGSVHGVEEIREHCDAVMAARLLLDNPDPVTPLIDKLGTMLRSALSAALAEIEAAYDLAVAGLQGSDEWRKLDEGQQKMVLEGAGLVLPRKPDLSSDDQLLTALSAQPLASYMERIDALAPKVAAARKAMAEIIDPEPKVVIVKPSSATLKNAADVDSYVSALSAQLMQHINAGSTVITAGE